MSNVLHRILTPTRGIGLSLGAVVGSGVFLLPAYIAGLLPHPGAFLIIWLVGLLAALCEAFSYSELATAFPRTGGYVVYVREIYGDRFAFVYGWAALLVLYPSSVATIARAFGRYAASLGGLSESAITPLAIGAIGLATVINGLGVRLSSSTQVVTTGLKVGALLLLAVVGVVRSGAAPPAPPVPWPDVSLGTWFLALVAVSWCTTGFLEVVVVAGEVKQPAQTLRRVLVGSVVLMTATYLLYNVALMKQVGLAAMDGSPAVASDLAQAILGSAGARLVDAIVVLATGSAILTFLFTGPRILVGLSAEGLFYERAGALSRFGTPALAVVVAGAAALIYATVGTFEELVKYFGVTTGLFSAMILGGGMWLRRRGRIAAEHHRIPLWPWIPIFALVLVVGGVIYAALDQPRASAIGVAILVASLPLAHRFQSRSTGST